LVEAGKQTCATHRQLEARIIVATLKIADRLRVHAHRIGEIAARSPPFGAKDGNAVVNVHAFVIQIIDPLCKHNETSMQESTHRRCRYGVSLMVREPWPRRPAIETHFLMIARGFTLAAPR